MSTDHEVQHRAIAYIEAYLAQAELPDYSDRLKAEMFDLAVGFLAATLDQLAYLSGVTTAHYWHGIVQQMRREN